VIKIRPLKSHRYKLKKISQSITREVKRKLGRRLSSEERKELIRGIKLQGMKEGA
jgi:hypothetical protein